MKAPSNQKTRTAALDPKATNVLRRPKPPHRVHLPRSAQKYTYHWTH
jgi:hypothetical protein